MMRLINLLLLIVLVALAIFATTNWQAIMMPIPLSLLFSQAKAPLGLILLSITGLLLLLFLGFIVYMQSSTLMIRRRLTKEVEAQRKLADEAETSRFTELRKYLETELKEQNTQHNELHQKMEAKLAEVAVSVNSKVEETGASLSAYIGELGDRLDKKLS